METKTIEILDQAKLKVFGQVASLDEARQAATTLLPDSQPSDVNEALDLYHNTLIEVVKKKVRNT